MLNKEKINIGGFVEKAIRFFALTVASKVFYFLLFAVLAKEGYGDNYISFSRDFVFVQTFSAVIALPISMIGIRRYSDFGVCFFDRDVVLFSLFSVFAYGLIFYLAEGRLLSFGLLLFSFFFLLRSFFTFGAVFVGLFYVSFYIVFMLGSILIIFFLGGKGASHFVAAVSLADYAILRLGVSNARVPVVKESMLNMSFSFKRMYDFVVLSFSVNSVLIGNAVFALFSPNFGRYAALAFAAIQSRGLVGIFLSAINQALIFSEERANFGTAGLFVFGIFGVSLSFAYLYFIFGDAFALTKYFFVSAFSLLIVVFSLRNTLLFKQGRTALMFLVSLAWVLIQFLSYFLFADFECALAFSFISSAVLLTLLSGRVK